MIYFVRFYFNVPNFVHPNPKAANNPKTLIKVNIHISGSVKTYKTSGQDMTRPSGGLEIPFKSELQQSSRLQTNAFATAMAVDLSR